MRLSYATLLMLTASCLTKMPDTPPYGVLYGIADGQLQRLQSVQNAAARLVTGTRRTDHITPVL